MRQLYEGMFLFDSNLASRDWPGLERHVEDLLKKHSAELVYSERWPDRKMAYEIKGCRKGTYYLTYFNASSGAISGLERDCQLSDRILRLLVIRDESVEEDLERRQRRQVESEEKAAAASAAEAGGGPEKEPPATESSAPKTAADKGGV